MVVGDAGELSIALAHFQEMRESGEFCCLEILSDYHYVWGVAYVRDDREVGAKHERHTVGLFNKGTLVEALEEAYTEWKAGRLA